MSIPLIVMAACLVVLLLTQFYLLRRNEESLRREARAQADRSELVEFMNRYTSSINYSRDIEQWMTQVAGFISTSLEAQAVWIYMLEDEGVARLMAFSGSVPVPDSSTSSQTRRLLAELTQDVIEFGHGTGVASQIFGSVSSLKEDFNELYGTGPVQSLISVPIWIEREQIGAITAINRTGPTPSYSVDDLFLLESMSSQLALGLTFVQIYEVLDEQRRIEQELGLAQTIQESLLPQDPPDHDIYLIHADCKAAREVSGDFYDFIQVSDDLMLTVVADASGKGIPACLLMAMCRSMIRSNAMRFKEDLEGFMRALNHALNEDTDAAQFVTMACLLIDKHDHVVEYARAGHTSLLMRHPAGHVEAISPEGPALGLLPDEIGPQYDTFTFTWEPGASLLLYTDGLTEALNDEEEEFGIDRLVHAWNQQNGDPVAATEGIFKHLEDFSGDQPRLDDQTLMVLKRPEA